MKRLFSAIIAVALTLSLSAQPAKHNEWYFNAKHTTHFVEKGCYHASVGKGEIEFIGKKAVCAYGNNKKSRPAAEGTTKGDYWLVKAFLNLRQNAFIGFTQTVINLLFHFCLKGSFQIRKRS